jgi:hypothetical protein
MCVHGCEGAVAISGAHTVGYLRRIRSAAARHGAMLAIVWASVQ